MKSVGSRLAQGERRALLAALFSVLLSSCTSTLDPTLSAGMPGYNASGPSVVSAAGPATADDDSAAPAGPQTLMSAEGDAALPDQVAALPSAKPGADVTIAPPAAAETIAGNTPQSLQPAAEPGQADAATVETAATAQAVKTQDADPTTTAPVMDNPVYVTAGEGPQPQAYAPKKKGFFASLFGAPSASAAPAPQKPAAAPQQTEAEAEPAQPAKPLVTLVSADASDKPLSLASAGSSGNAFADNSLPGVRQTALFEIKRKSGLDDDSDVDLNEEDTGSYQVASAAGLARLAPNGLLKQTEGVDIACLKPSLVRVLKTIEGHYGKKLIVTSGYRDPNRNRRANGAKRSLHMYCAAADIQVPGVGKWELASYARSMAGRGGVGTYCHTKSVHVDVGPERDWNWRCRRRK